MNFSQKQTNLAIVAEIKQIKKFKPKQKYSILCYWFGQDERMRPINVLLSAKIIAKTGIPLLFEFFNHSISRNNPKFWQKFMYRSNTIHTIVRLSSLIA